MRMNDDYGDEMIPLARPSDQRSANKEKIKRNETTLSVKRNGCTSYEVD
jgi:hypothetical protein